MTTATDRTLLYPGMVVVAGVLAPTLEQTQGLARLPSQTLLKNELHPDGAANAAFFVRGCVDLKQFAGIGTDALPLSVIVRSPDAEPLSEAASPKTAFGD